jgi:protein phosphatase
MTAVNDDPADTAEYSTLDELFHEFFEAEPRTPVRAEFAALTHAGKVRETNEDQYLVVRRSRKRQVLASSLPADIFPEPEQVAYTITVADGMGGHAFGDVASLLAMLTGWDLGGREVKWTVKINEREVEDLHKKAQIVFRTIHEALIAATRAEPRFAGMGTTLTVCYTTGPELFVLHAGDSRAYLFRGGKIERLTRDHTVAQELIDAGMPPESAQARISRNVLTNCLGGPMSDVHVDMSHHRLADGDRLLMCTDGLNDRITDDELAATLSAHPRIDEACRVLLDMALERGGKDNITVVLGAYSIPADATASASADSQSA